MKRTMIATLTCLLLTAGCGSGPFEPHDDPTRPALTAQSESALHGVGRDYRGVRTEANLPSQGRYREVMGFNGCTATVIAPYTVLTADHCKGSGYQAIGWRYRSGDTGASTAFCPESDNPSDGCWLRAHVGGYNPYVRKDEFPPVWWHELNESRRFPNPGDWPAMHDQHVLFVPDLTPEFIERNGLIPPTINGKAGADTYTTLGVSSGDGTVRYTIQSSFVSATPNTITSSPRDGYLTLNGRYSALDGGDSGGPTLGYSSVVLSSGRTLTGPRRVVATNHNSGGDLAPAGLVNSPTMTDNQRTTVRLNQLWLRSRAADPDGDGLPAECDGLPGRYSFSNSCPASIGYPTNAVARYNPQGMLRCKEGFMPVGMRVRAGAMVDSLALKCRRVACFYRADQSCGGDYWTDHFGGTGGSERTFVCPTGSMLGGLMARVNSGSRGALRSFEATCRSFSDLITMPSRERLVTLGTVGNDWGRTAYGTRQDALCSAGRYLAGFDARSSKDQSIQQQTVSGLQPICALHRPLYTSSVGGSTGHTHGLRCPEGQLVVGVAAKTQGSVVGFFALICGSEEDVVNRRYQPKTVLRGSYWDPSRHDDFPAMVQRYDDYVTTRPVGIASESCPVGYAVEAITVKAGDLIDRIHSIRCAYLGSGTRADVTRYVGVGGWGGSYRTLSCGPSYKVDGAVLQTGALTDGLALHCNK